MLETEDGKVTLAVIQRDILHLTMLLESFLASSKLRDERIERIDKRLTRIEPTVATIAKVLEIALYVIVITAIGAIAWAAVQSGALL